MNFQYAAQWGQKNWNRNKVPSTRFHFFTYISYELSHPRSFSICSTMGSKNFEIALIFFEPSFYVSRDIFHSFEQCEDRQNVMNFLADISNTTSERISPHCIHLKWKEEWSIVTYILCITVLFWHMMLAAFEIQSSMWAQIANCASYWYLGVWALSETRRN